MSFVRGCSLFLALLALASCGELTGSGDEAAPIVVAPVGGVVRVTNRSSVPVYYIAFESGTAAATLWSACTDPGRCPHINPGEMIGIPNAEFSGYKQGKDSGILYWWLLDGSSKPEVHNINVDFQ